MKKVRLFVCADMTVLDLGQKDTYCNFHSYNRQEVIANVTEINRRDRYYKNGSVDRVYEIVTDFVNPYRSVCSKFTLAEDNYNCINWVE